MSRCPSGCKTRFVLGTVTKVDATSKTVSWAGPEGTAGEIGYDRLILTAGSVNKLLPIPGTADYAHGFRTIAEVVGAGYTGTEVAAQGQLMTTRIAKTLPGLAGQQIRWMLLDTAPRVLTDWTLNGLTSPEATSVTLVSAASVPLDVDRPTA